MVNQTYPPILFCLAHCIPKEIHGVHTNWKIKKKVQRVFLIGTYLSIIYPEFYFFIIIHYDVTFYFIINIIILFVYYYFALKCRI